MNKIYITGVPLDSNFILEEKAFSPQNFEMDNNIQTSFFPIIPIIENTVKPGDRVKIILMRQENGKGNINLNIFFKELKQICETAEVIDITTAENQTCDTLMDLYKNMVKEMENDCDYYIDITFGPKPFAAILFTLFSYITNIKQNADIKGIYYQEILREKGKTESANIYEMSILNDLSKFMCSIAGSPQKSKEKTIDLLLEG